MQQGAAFTIFHNGAHLRSNKGRVAEVMPAVDKPVSDTAGLAAGPVILTKRIGRTASNACCMGSCGASVSGEGFGFPGLGATRMGGGNVMIPSRCMASMVTLAVITLIQAFVPTQLIAWQNARANPARVFCGNAPIKCLQKNLKTKPSRLHRSPTNRIGYNRTDRISPKTDRSRVGDYRRERFDNASEFSKPLHSSDSWIAGLRLGI